MTKGDIMGYGMDEDWGEVAAMEDDREENPTEFDKMLHFHEMDEVEDWQYLSGNDKRNCWSSYYLSKPRRTAKKVEDMSNQYLKNKSAKVGAEIKCACGCGKAIIKKSYQTQFASNKGRGNCKDRYWNK